MLILKCTAALSKDQPRAVHSLIIDVLGQFLLQKSCCFHLKPYRHEAYFLHILEKEEKVAVRIIDLAF